MFGMLNLVGRLLQVIGSLIPVGGVLLAAAALMIGSNSTVSPLPLALGSIVAGLVFYGFGGLICVNVAIARNTQRTANALIYLARRQPVAPEFIPPPPQDYHR